MKILHSKITIFIAIFTLIVFFLFSDGIQFTSDDQFFIGFHKWTPKHIFTQAKSVDSGLLKGEKQDRINALLLGIGGQNHEGADLTDTLMLLSYQPSKQKLGIVSIPRDLIVYIPDYGWRKINHVYYFNKKENPEKGAEKTTQFIGDLFDLPIHYHAVVNFKGFQEFIDALGGIDVQVQNTLDDYAYPIQGKENDFPISSRYEHLHIEKGIQHMDGQTALKFARSRHAEGVEGSDYARARRQQNIMIAVKEKLFSFKTLINPKKIIDLIDIMKDNLTTNIKIPEILRLIGLARKFSKEDMITKVVDASPDGPLVENHYDGAFVLEPKTGNFDELIHIIRYVFDTDKKYKRKTVIHPTPMLPAVITKDKEKTIALGQGNQPTIEIRNGTQTPNLASKNQSLLEKMGFNVLQIGNARKQNHPHSLLIIKNEIAELTQKLSKSLPIQIYDSLPQGIPSSQADYLLILGQDACPNGYEQKTNNH